MTKTIQATFDGHVLHPDEPLTLPPNSRVTVTISVPEESPGGASFLDTAMSLRLAGPPDWSEKVASVAEEVVQMGVIEEQP